MKIAVIGSGALGLYYGAKLVQSGNDVHFLLRRDYEAIHSKGLTVHSIGGDFHIDLQGYRSTSEIGKVDLVIIGLKTFANHLYKELIAPLMGPETILLTLQNGLGNEEELARLFDADRVVGGVAYLASNRGEPGVVNHLGEGRIVLGEYSKREVTPRAEKLAALFNNAGVTCLASADLVRARWEKLIWNIPFNGISALMQKPVDLLLRHNLTKQLILDIMAEVIAAANAQGLTKLIDERRGPEMVEFTGTLGSYKPSMQIDREERRPLELNAIFAIPLARAAERGVPMRKVEELFALLDLGEPN